jgi:hypothetical protein
MKRPWQIALILLTLALCCLALVIWLRPKPELILRAYYTGKQPATRLKIVHSDVVDARLERGQHLQCVLHPIREEGISVSYLCQDNPVSFSFGYVGPGYYGEIILVFDEEGCILSDGTICPGSIWAGCCFRDRRTVSSPVELASN